MPKLNFELAFATLIPEFLYQFLSNAQIDRQSITCLDFEDLRDAVKNTKEPELDGIRQFLGTDANEAGESGLENPADGLTREEQLEKMSDELDAELEDVDDELFHRYTPGEIKYIFGEITDRIDEIYKLYKEHAGLNLALSAGFKFKSGFESGLVVEFLSVNENPEYLEDVFFVPMKNYFVSDGIIARVYLVYEKEKEAEIARELAGIAETLQVKAARDTAPHEHGPDCGHLH